MTICLTIENSQIIPVKSLKKLSQHSPILAITNIPNLALYTLDTISAINLQTLFYFAHTANTISQYVYSTHKSHYASFVAWHFGIIWCNFDFYTPPENRKERGYEELKNCLNWIWFFLFKDTWSQYKQCGSRHSNLLDVVIFCLEAKLCFLVVQVRIGPHSLSEFS